MTKLLELRNVTKIFKGGTLAVDDVSFAVETTSPSIIAIAGESGSGKTTLGLMTLGFLDPRLGSGDLQIPESSLISLPWPRVVVPDQPANGNQQDQAGDGEPAVQSGDVVQKIFAFFRQR